MNTSAESPDSLLAKARAFAVAAHGEQKYGERPYSWHLDAVVALLTQYGEQAQIAGYLHDVVEDTSVGLDEVRENFGDAIAASVALLTDAPGATRKERKAKTYAKLAEVRGENQVALVVKAADRLANVRACVADGKQDLLQIYREEHPVFRNAAYRPGLCESLWVELDRLLK